MTPKPWLTLSDGSILTRQEQFVLRQVANGEIADLKQEFGEAEADRRLRARFLEELLTGELKGVEVHRRGVRIKYAFIDEAVDLENAEVGNDVWLYNSILTGSVSFRAAYFKNDLILKGSLFFKEADFQRLKVAGAIFCDNTVFLGSVDFSGATITGQFTAERSKFLSENHNAIFNGMQVGLDARFDGAEIHGIADFGGVDIRGEFGALGAKFLDKDREVNFNDMRVGRNARFDGAEFRGAADFVGADIIGQLGANDAKFLAEDQTINFSSMRVGQSAYFEGTEFHGLVYFVGADIRGQFVADGAKFLGKNQEVNLNGMLVGHSAFFRGCDFKGIADFTLIKVAGNLHLTPLPKSGLLMATTFRGPVNFAGAIIGIQLRAQGSKFLAENHEVIFNGMQVGQDAIFNEAEFHGPIDFAAANIHGQFQAQRAIFLSNNHKANFNSMQVEAAFLQGAEFFGVVDLVLIKVEGNLYLDPLLKTGVEISTTFRSGVNFHGADIGGELLADKAQFLGHIVNFEAVRVGRSFHASGALFAGSVNFTDMTVKKNFYMNPFGRIKTFKTLFKGAANFSNLEVRGVFNADQAIFQSESTIFSGLKVGQGAFFIGTIFFGGLVLKEGQLTDLVIRGLHRLSKGGLPLTEIVLNRTKIAHRLTIEDVEEKRFDARNLEVKGPAEFSRVLIKDEADFRDAAIHHLQMVEIDWPEPKDSKKKVFLDGLTYESITTRKEPDKPEDWPKLLAWLGLSRFNTQNYQQLDAFFQRGGLRKWADQVYIAGKRRELGKRQWWDPARWLIKFFWGLLAGYGRKPGRTLWISLLLIILGAFILNPAEVLPPDFLNNLAGYQDNVVHLIALRLIVSLYSLVAAIPGWGGHLSVSSPEFHLFIFLWFQRICGWILIPIGLAALYTRLK